MHPGSETGNCWLLTDSPDDLETRRGVALSQNNLAWFLATREPASLRQPQTAVALAKEAIKVRPQRGLYWNSLGVAYYRVGDWQSAIASLEKAEELSPGDDLGYNAFFLAMAHWQLGSMSDLTAAAKMTHHDAAQQWLARAIGWVEKNEPRNKELKRFRAEAEELMGLNK